MTVRTVCLLLTVLLTGAAAEGRPVEMRDLTRLVRLTDPHVSPDGKTVVAVESRADLDADEWRSELIAVDLASHQRRPLTLQRHHAGAPRFSPAGDRLGFLAPDADKHLQVFVLPMGGGDAVQVTQGKESVSQFAWSPDGAQIAFARADLKPELKGEAEHRTACRVGIVAFSATEAVRPTHLWIVPTAGGEARRLTHGDWSLPSSLPPGPPSSPIGFSADGKSLLFVRQETPSTGDQLEVHVQVLDIATGALRSLTGDTRLEAYPVLSPDGQQVAYWRNRDAKPWNFQDVWLAPLSGGGGRDVSRALDRNVFLTQWSAHGDWLLVGGNAGTGVGFWRLKPDGTSARIELGGIVPAGAYWYDAGLAPDDSVVFVGQSATDPFELYRTKPDGGTEQLTQVNASLGELALARTETVTWKGPGGRTLDGVLTYPSRYQAGTRSPLVLYIHGGPNANSRERFSVAQQVFAAHGWLVFEPNYRGSDSQDNAFYAAIYQDAGQGPGEDVMSGVEFLKHRGLVDAARMAVTGWSYGGYMTTWLAGHYPVWKAAVAGAPVTDWVQMYDLSDGNVTTAMQTGGSPYLGDGMQLNRRQSPLSMVTHITAPTLILCDTGDFRVPITQSFSLYRALRDNHVPTEFYAIPTGGHFPGDPINQLDVYERWNDWLAAHLK